MKRVAMLLGVAILLSAFFFACNLFPQDAEVRFQNSTDFTLFYGVKYGEAQYIGTVPPGFISQYYATSPGTYSLQARDVAGNWVTISTGSMSVEGGHKYTIVGTGTGGVYFWNIVQDE